MMFFFQSGQLGHSTNYKYNIASARIHVERKMEQIKNFRKFQGILPLSLGGVADYFFICSALTNLLPLLVK